MKRKFVVEMEIPKGAKIIDCVEYISDAVTSWVGSLHPPGAYGPDDPGNPLFMLNRDSVRVTRLYKR